MDNYQKQYEVEKESAIPVNLIMELTEKIKKLEKRLDELSRSWEAEAWF